MAATQTPNQPALQQEHTVRLCILLECVCIDCLRKLHLLGQEAGSMASTESLESLQKLEG